MTTSVRDTMTDYLDALRARGDYARHFTDDVLWTTMETGDQIRGREAVRDLIEMLHGTLDGRIEIRKVAVDEGYAVLEADLVGTHIGEFAGIPATGAPVRVPYAVTYDVAPEGITALRAYVPMSTLVQQLQQAAQAAQATQAQEAQPQPA